MNSLRFLFEGQRITDNHTPKEVSFVQLKLFRTQNADVAVSAAVFSL